MGHWRGVTGSVGARAPVGSGAGVGGGVWGGACQGARELAWGRRQGRQRQERWGGRMPGLCRGPCVWAGAVGGEEGEARSAVLARGRWPFP